MPRKRAQDFFRKLYLPALAAAGDGAARKSLGGIKGRATINGSGPGGFDKLSKTQRIMLGKRGGAARWAKLDPEERRKQLLAAAARMRKAVTPQARREKAVKAGRASWQGLTPEERKRRVALAVENLAKLKRPRFGAPWPFPDRKMTLSESQPLAAAAAQAAARHRRFLRGK